MMRGVKLAAAAIAAAATLCAAIAFAEAPADAAGSRCLSVESRPLPCERLNGIVALRFTLHTAHGDTSGLAILDTGAGPLAIDRGLLPRMDFVVDDPAPLVPTPAPVTGFHIEGLDTSAPQAAAALDLEPMRVATGRPLAALAGAALWRERALLFDPREDVVRVAMSPVMDGDVQSRIGCSRARLASWLSSSARALPFELRGDSKIVLEGHVGDGPAIRWILDTGATKVTLFPRALRDAKVALPRGRELSGLLATTLEGEERVRYRRLPRVSVRAGGDTVSAEHVDVALLDAPIADAIGRVVGLPVHGVLGQSFLRRFRHVIDYGTRVVWFEPIDVPVDQRPWEYCSIGVQLGRRDQRTMIEAVADGSPAQRAGLRAGDMVIGVDDADVDALPLVEADQRLEGPPGTRVLVRVRRGDRVVERDVQRRRLL